jgi:hypothetical protein
MGFRRTISRYLPMLAAIGIFALASIAKQRVLPKNYQNLISSPD